MATPNMNLTLPTVSSTVGPTWATQLNAALTLVDSHNHTSGQGVQIPTAGINLNADLAFNSFNATLLRSTRFSSQSSPLSLGTDANCLYVSLGNLFYNNGSGQQVQITAGAAISAASLGGITGLTAPASAAYNAGTSTFTLLQNANRSALLDVGTLIIHDPGGTSVPGITIQSPVGLAGAYSLTLPAVLPGATSLLTLSATGVLASSVTLTIDGSGNLTFNAASGQSLTKTGGAFTLGTGDANALVLKTNATSRWSILSTGELQAQGANRAVQSVLDPVTAQDAATKNYVDTKAVSVLHFGANSLASATTTNALQVGGAGAYSSTGGSINSQFMIMPCAGTLRDLQYYIVTGASSTFNTVTVLKNGSSVASQSMNSVAPLDPATGSISGVLTTVVAGDKIQIKCDTTGSGGSQGPVVVSIKLAAS